MNASSNSYIIRWYKLSEGHSNSQIFTKYRTLDLLNVYIFYITYKKKKNTTHKNLSIESKGEKIELFINSKHNYWITLPRHNHAIAGEC